MIIVVASSCPSNLWSLKSWLSLNKVQQQQQHVHNIIHSSHTAATDASERQETQTVAVEESAPAALMSADVVMINSADSCWTTPAKWTPQILSVIIKTHFLGQWQRSQDCWEERVKQTSFSSAVLEQSDQCWYCGLWSLTNVVSWAKILLRPLLMWAAPESATLSMIQWLELTLSGEWYSCILILIIVSKH